MTLFAYTTKHPAYRHPITIDACAETREAAVKSLRRFIGRENRRLARAGIKQRIRVPGPLQIREG